MSDEERVNHAIEEGWTGERGLRRMCMKLVNDVRNDERERAAKTAEKHSDRVAAAIRMMPK